MRSVNLQILWSNAALVYKGVHQNLQNFVLRQNLKILYQYWIYSMMKYARTTCQSCSNSRPIDVVRVYFVSLTLITCLESQIWPTSSFAKHQFPPDMSYKRVQIILLTIHGNCNFHGYYPCLISTRCQQNVIMKNCEEGKKANLLSHWGGQSYLELEKEYMKGVWLHILVFDLNSENYTERLILQVIS